MDSGFGQFNVENAMKFVRRGDFFVLEGWGFSGTRVDTFLFGSSGRSDFRASSIQLESKLNELLVFLKALEQKQEEKCVD